MSHTQRKYNFIIKYLGNTENYEKRKAYYIHITLLAFVFPHELIVILKKTGKT